MHISYLNKYYFINEFNSNHIKKLDKNISIIYRNYSSPIDVDLIKKIKKVCKMKGQKFFLSNNFKLALKLNLDGVYLPSFNNEIRCNLYTLKKKFLVIGSAHNIKEIRIKEQQKIKQIFLSPIFKVKNGRYLGLNRFRILSLHTKINKIALGGINKTNYSKLKNINIFGFAGISFFEPKKKGP